MQGLVEGADAGASDGTETSGDSDKSILDRLEGDLSLPGSFDTPNFFALEEAGSPAFLSDWMVQGNIFDTGTANGIDTGAWVDTDDRNLGTYAAVFMNSVPLPPSVWSGLSVLGLAGGIAAIRRRAQLKGDGLI